MIQIQSTLATRHRLLFSILAILLALLGASTSAQQFENEEVLFFDGSAAQTGTQWGGTVILPLETNTWRFWYQDVFHSAVSPNINVTQLKGQTPQILVKQPESP